MGDMTIIRLQPILKDLPFTLEHVSAGKNCLKPQQRAITISKDTFKIIPPVNSEGVNINPV